LLGLRDWLFCCDEWGMWERRGRDVRRGGTKQEVKEEDKTFDSFAQITGLAADEASEL